MAHEELKALYEIDKQHSDTPWEFWQHRKLYQVWCDCLPSGPEWDDGSQYRRKPDAPVWPDDKEDARKWRELDKHFEDAEKEDHRAFHWKFLDIKYGKAEPQLIQGYTAEQWQTIIDGEFLCEFSDTDWPLGSVFQVGTLTEIGRGDKMTFSSRTAGSRYGYCRPLRTKGVRQPWFGGECPVNEDARVSYVLRDGYKDQTEAWRIRWEHKEMQSDIVEFIEL